ncbi:MAG: hypothetical protein OXC93_12495 [Rhodospirillaceae bacterium]|nr:hypothetical protein [Rhodospirillaceae bacterium]
MLALLLLSEKSGRADDRIASEMETPLNIIDCRSWLRGSWITLRGMNDIECSANPVRGAPDGQRWWPGATLTPGSSGAQAASAVSCAPDRADRSALSTAGQENIPRNVVIRDELGYLSFARASGHHLMGRLSHHG